MTLNGNINNQTPIPTNILLQNGIQDGQDDFNNLIQSRIVQSQGNPQQNPLAADNINIQQNTIQDFLGGLPVSSDIAALQNGQLGVTPDFLQNVNAVPSQIGGFSAAGLDNVGRYAQSLGYITDITNRVGQLGYQTGEASAYYSYLDAVNNYYGQLEQNRLNEFANRANVALDLEQLALRNNYGIMQKQTEMYVLDAQVREKLMNTFFEIEKVKLDNTFQRAKQIVQAAKY